MKRFYAMLLVLLALPVLAAAQARPVPPAQAQQPKTTIIPGQSPKIVWADQHELGAWYRDATYAVTRAQGYADWAHTDVVYAQNAAKTIQGYSYGADAWIAPGAQTWHQGDPADSLYRVAHNLFQRQEYRPAADRYSELRTKHPNSRYFCDAAYYEGFARYRLGTPNDLRTANRVLDGMNTRCTTAARRQDVPELQARVDGALARLGDNEAAERVRRAAGATCDSEERSVKITALATLAQMDAQAATPVLRSVLNTKDQCSIPIRRQALEMIARRNDAEAVNILNMVARNDPDRETQAAAVRTLSRMSNDAAYTAVEEYLKSSTDERIQVEAASALASNENARAQAAVRALIERKDVAERIRISAINSLGSRNNLSLDYWKGLYAKVESDDLRKAVLYAVARIQTDEAQAFLLQVARSPNEPSAARAAALSRVAASAPINDLYRMLDNADSRAMRLSIVNSLASRREPDATDRLIDIAKNPNVTDPEVRNAAIRALSQPPRRNDPKVIKALEDILASNRG